MTWKAFDFGCDRLVGKEDDRTARRARTKLDSSVNRKAGLTTRLEVCCPLWGIGNQSIN